MTQLRPTYAPTAKKQLSVAFLLADDFTLSAFASFVDVLRLAADEADRSRQINCEWTVLSDTMNPVRSSCGVKVQPDTRLRNAGQYDYIVVVGGLIQEASGLSAQCMQFVIDAARKNVPLIGLCTGVFQLYEAGLLEGYRVCVNWFHHDEFVARFESVRPVSDQIFVVDRDRLTCSGGHGAAHLAAWLVEKHIGRTAATKSLSIMIIDEAMKAENPQPGYKTDFDPRDTIVRKALLRMRQNIETPEPVEKLAQDLGISRRQLERRFKTDIGVSPARAELRIRLDVARQMLRTGHKTATEIALATGFCDASHFINAFKAEAGMTPSEFRLGTTAMVDPAPLL
ncbi:GlxA family transcriptional regulator [Thalassospira sp. MA62]|nr:GlxA family transcriptional regulator [Thalassospira sp. MA62]